MALDIAQLENITIGSARGRKPGRVEMLWKRNLNAGDLEVILAPPEHGVKTPIVKQLRATHHMAARLMAEGRPQQEVSSITGYSPSRLSILKHDPAFSELVEYYKSNVEAQYLDVHARMAALGLATLDELQERLEQEPEGWTKRELMDLAALMLDRSGFGPKGQQGQGGGGGAALALTVKFVKGEHAGEPEPPAQGTVIDVTCEEIPQDSE